MNCPSRWIALALLLVAPACAAAEPAMLPDPIMTPGAVDRAATLNVICNGTTRARRHVTAAERAEVLAAYNIPPSQAAFYEIDHLVPLAIGGANVVANLWPQPWAEADQKDALEVELQRHACVAFRTLAPADSAAVLAQEQREIAGDWTAAYSRYLGGRPAAAPDPGSAAVAAPAARSTGKARLRAEALRLIRRWILGNRLED